MVLKEYNAFVNCKGELISFKIMNISFLLSVILGYFALGYWLYGGFLTRIFGIDTNRVTPAVEKNDGYDYVPTHPSVVFGHHFATIAGAGPLIGPILASYFGWLPALLWILIGCVFIGAVHDFAALFLSVRNGGDSIGKIIEKLLGLTGRQLFLFFSFVLLLLVVAVFALLVVDTFIKTPAVATSSILFIAIAPIFGFLTKKVFSLKVGTFIFVPLILVIVYLSVIYNINLADYGLTPEQIKYVWLGFIGLYVFLAAVIPVDWLLQPRDYLSSYLLYIMLALGVLGVFFYQPTLQMEAFKGYTVLNAGGKEMSLFPALFILVACGACSGFHSLAASGTTSKQVRSEKDILRIGYGAMIVEGVIGVISLITVAYLSPDSFAEIAKNPVNAFASGVGTFATKLGLPFEVGLTFVSLAISTFMLTSADTATRLTRFVFQELCSSSCKNEDSNRSLSKVTTKAQLSSNPLIKFVSNSIVATVLIMALEVVLIFTDSATDIWPVFGAANQLLAALTLLCISLYLIKKKSNYFITLFPTFFMLVTSIYGLYMMTYSNSSVISLTSILLILMSVVLVVLSVIMIVRTIKANNSSKKK